MEVPLIPGPTDKKTLREEPSFGGNKSKETHFPVSVIIKKRAMSATPERRMPGNHAVKT